MERPYRITKDIDADLYRRYKDHLKNELGIDGHGCQSHLMEFNSKLFKTAIARILNEVEK